MFLFEDFDGSEKSRFCVRLVRQLLARNFGSLLWQQDRLDVWQNAALGDGNAGEQFVQLLVVSDGQLQMTRDDSRLLVISCSVAGQLEHFGGKIFHHCGQVNRGSGADSFSVVALAQQTMDTTDWELKSRSAGSALRLSLDFASLSTSRHDEYNSV